VAFRVRTSTRMHHQHAEVHAQHEHAMLWHLLQTCQHPPTAHDAACWVTTNSCHVILSTNPQQTGENVPKIHVAVLHCAE
jgi:hypothetical protein